MNFTITKPNISQEEFLNHLVKVFPEISDEVLDEDYADLIHLQIACLARYANQLIQHSRFDVLRRVFSFFSVTVEKVDSDTENALYVSFLEHVEMDGDSVKAREARALLPAKYLPVWKALRQ
ncbi:hypothetical protein ACFQ48_13305 [Hymenobacter caeli]|uniref:DUF7674 domain-containing protein n=1 Tax=Hymenobacter caeli TaxID=2735894 RepID=A0ABX2FV94_9BACT|nr:hypothetical protein [Hymenobacter caeli]NRT20406.1 hypothetical protein [Hymenobacter caeli]